MGMEIRCIYVAGCKIESYCSKRKQCAGEEDLRDSAASISVASEHSNITSTLQDRKSVYGKWEDNSRVSQSLKTWLSQHKNWHKLDVSKKEALEMIAQKIARILNGDPNYKDNWHDIGGYAKLAEDSCTSSPQGIFRQTQGPKEGPTEDYLR